MTKLKSNELNKSPENLKIKSTLMTIIERYKKDKVDWTLEMLADESGVSLKEVTEILVCTSSADISDSVASLIPSPEEAFSGDTFYTLET